MSVTFTAAGVDTCTTCYVEGPVLKHNEFHPICEKCLQLWTDINPVCPQCRSPIKPPFWKAAVKETVMVGIDLVNGLQAGGMVLAFHLVSTNVFKTDLCKNDLLSGPQYAALLPIMAVTAGIWTRHYEPRS